MSAVRTIAIVNQKGGCGKTTTAINLAAICAGRGLRTLIVDMDPQSHCAAGLGVPEDSLDNHIGHALTADVSRGYDRGNLVWEVSRNLDLAPSTMSLAALEAPGGGLHALPDKDRRLAVVLKHLAPHYDRCFVDCPPNVGLLTYNALRAAGEAIIPVETGFFSLKGARKQWETIRHLVDHVKHPITCYILPTLYNEDEKIARDILGAIRKQFGGRVIPIVIREQAEIREAASFGQPVSEYAPESESVKDFEQLADWLDDHPADPPEIQIEVTRSVTVPWYTPDCPAPAPMAASAGDAPSEPVMGLGAVAPPSSRAAEMALKVRQMAMARTAQPKQSSAQDEGKRATPLPTPAATSTTAEDASKVGAAKLGEDIASLRNAKLLAAQRRATLVESKDLPAEIDSIRSNLVRLFGVRQTAHGVLFIQPGAPGMSISVVGSFNGWSTSASPMRYNRDTSVYELILPLPRGQYEYRLFVDGRWETDAYNTRRRTNEFGEDNNYFDVE